MPDFPNELVEAAACAITTSGRRGSTDQEAQAYDAAYAALTAVVPLIEQRVIERLAREAGENPYPEFHLPEHDGATGYADPCHAAWDEGAACGVAAERERNEDDLAIAMWGAGVVLPPVDQDEPPAEPPMFREGGLRHGTVRPFRSADAPQETPGDRMTFPEAHPAVQAAVGPLCTLTMDTTERERVKMAQIVLVNAAPILLAAGRSAERARLAEAGNALAGELRRKECKCAYIGEGTVLTCVRCDVLAAWRAALSEGTPDAPSASSEGEEG